MARLRYLDPEDLAEADRDLLTRRNNLFRALVNSPDALRHFRFGHWIRFESTVDPRLREMAILQVGHAARQPYEWSHHIRVGREFGVTEDDVRAIMADSAGEESTLSPLERAVLAAARQMERDGRIDEATFATLNEGLGADQVVQLVLAIAHYCGVVRILTALEIDVEPEYQTYLEQFPLPG